MALNFVTFDFKEIDEEKDNDRGKSQKNGIKM